MAHSHLSPSQVAALDQIRAEAQNDLDKLVTEYRRALDSHDPNVAFDIFYRASMAGCPGCLRVLHVAALERLARNEVPR